MIVVLHHVLVVAIHLGGAGVSAFAASWALRRTYTLYDWPDPWYHALVAGLGLSAGLGVVAALLRLRRWRRGEWRDTDGAPLRGAFSTAVLAAVGFLVFVQPFKALFLLLWLGGVGGVHALVTLMGPRLIGATTRARFDGVVFRLCLAVVLVELTLKLAASVTSMPLLATGNQSVEEYMSRFRRPAGQLHLGYACDERGFNDVLRERAPGEKLVVGVGDSFTFGIIPRPMNYTEVAERAAPGIQIYNMGAPALGPAEYVALVRDDGVPLEPDAFLVSLFVGNDLDDARRVRVEHRFARSWFDRRGVMLALLPSRLMKLHEADPRGEGFAGWYGEGEPFAADATEADLVARYRWLADPMTEVASMDEERFLLVERERYAMAVREPDPRSFELLFEALATMRGLAGERPLLVMVIPDEFQVEDALWARVRTGPESERDLPQRRITGWCAENDVPCLDLLPVLRAVPPLADGGRHLYHLYDTHWNRRGNEVAGKALAEFLRRHVR